MCVTSKLLLRFSQDLSIIHTFCFTNITVVSIIFIGIISNNYPDKIIVLVIALYGGLVSTSFGKLPNNYFDVKSLSDNN